MLAHALHLQGPSENKNLLGLTATQLDIQQSQETSKLNNMCESIFNFTIVSQRQDVFQKTEIQK